MRVRETFHRGPELARERRAMSARTYNLTRILLARTADAFVFVPIRSMQYLAIVESGEFNFLHSEARPDIEISWQNFTPRERAALDDPVSYEAVYYGAQAEITMRRLQGELLRALEQMAARSAPAGSAVVLDLKRHAPD